MRIVIPKDKYADIHTPIPGTMEHAEIRINK